MPQGHAEIYRSRHNAKKHISRRKYFDGNDPARGPTLRPPQTPSKLYSPVVQAIPWEGFQHAATDYLHAPRRKQPPSSLQPYSNAFNPAPLRVVSYDAAISAGTYSPSQSSSPKSIAISCPSLSNSPATSPSSNRGPSPNFLQPDGRPDERPDRRPPSLIFRSSRLPPAARFSPTSRRSDAAFGPGPPSPRSPSLGQSYGQAPFIRPESPASFLREQGDSRQSRIHTHGIADARRVDVGAVYHPMAGTRRLSLSPRAPPKKLPRSRVPYSFVSNINLN
jgi:hypothetical protein